MSRTFTLLIFLQFWGPTCLLAGPDPAFLQKASVYDLLDLAEVASWKHLDSAFLLNDLALAKGRQTKDWVAVFYTLRERGIYFEKYNRPLEARPEYDKALAILDSVLEPEKLMPIALTDLAIVSRKCGFYNDCRHFHERALAIAKKNKDQELEEDSYHGLGFLYETVGDWEKATEFYQKSVQIAEKRGSSEGRVISFQNIAQVLHKSGNTQLALEKIEFAWHLAQQADSVRRGHVLHDYGEILTGAGQYNEALLKFQTSLGWYEQADNRPMMARSLLNIANVYALKGDKALALEFFKKAIQFGDAIRPEDLVKLWHDLGQVNLALNHTAEAEKAARACLELAAQYNFLPFFQKANLLLANVLERKGQPEAAYLYLKNATRLADSLNVANKEGRVAELEFRYQTEKAEKTIQALKSNNRMTLLGGFAVVSLLFGGFMTWQMREKVRHNRLLNRKNAEIERSNQQLRESNGVLQQFAYATAHDLKEPLRTIGSFVGLLERKHGKSFPPEAIEYFDFVKSGAVRMNTLLSDLLEYSTIFMDEPTLGRTDFAVGLREVVGNLQNSIQQNGAVVELPIELPMPAVQIKKAHFIQLFQNLLSNAIKFSPENPHIVVSVVRESNEKFLFSVRDNGIGINKNYGDKIFQIFQRLDRQRFEGAGIGLAICKNIVEKYGGQIWFESELDKGTTFFVRLPVFVEKDAVLVGGSGTNMGAFHQN